PKQDRCRSPGGARPERARPRLDCRAWFGQRGPEAKEPHRVPTLSADVSTLPLPFEFTSAPSGSCERIGEQAFVLRGFALSHVGRLLPALEAIQRVSPFRHMVTPGGYRMSVALTNCGELGWTTDRRGYRYARID